MGNLFLAGLVLAENDEVSCNPLMDQLGLFMLF